MSGDDDTGRFVDSSVVPPPPYSLGSALAHSAAAAPGHSAPPRSAAAGRPVGAPLGYEPADAPPDPGSGPLRSAVERLRDLLEAGALSGSGLRFGVAVCAAAALAAGLLLLWSRSGAPAEPPIPPDDSAERHERGGSPDAGEAPPAQNTEPSGTVVVHVGGDVEDPGLVELPEGARVADAVESAGGASEDADSDAVDALNLARRLVDGEQILVGADAPPGPGDAGAAQEGVPLDLNTATADQLESLPGVGPVTAEAIVEHRESNDGFGSVEELLDVRGIGEKRFEDLQERVIVHGS